MLSLWIGLLASGSFILLMACQLLIILVTHNGYTRELEAGNADDIIFIEMKTILELQASNV